ncbi:somatostatin receptor type 2-like [Littorina saxatilis]
MVLIAMLRTPRLRTSINLVVGSLAVSDLLTASGIPFIIVTLVKQQWVLGPALCIIIVYVQFVFGISSTLSLTLVSVERYLHVSVSPGRTISLPATLKLLAVSWVVSFLFPVPVALAQTVMTLRCRNENLQFCGVTWPDRIRDDVYMGSLIALFFVDPVVVMTVCYVRIFIIVRSSSARVKHGGGGRGGGGEAGGDGDSGGHCCQGSSRTSDLQLRLVKMSISIVLAFVFMWLPFFILSFMGVHSSSITSEEFTPTLVLALSNTALNPLLYGYFNTSFRREFKAIRGTCCDAKSRDVRSEGARVKEADCSCGKTRRAVDTMMTDGMRDS